MVKSERPMYEYQNTHSWLKFNLPIREFDYRTWLLLGEAKSKCEHIKNAPLLPDSFQKIMGVYLAKGALATTAIEGNTLTEEEAEKIINKQLVLPPSQKYLQKEIENIVEAVNYIGRTLKSDSCQITLEELLEFNKMVLNGLPDEEEVIPGVFRTHPVVVGKYRAVPYQDINYLMTEFIKFVNLEIPDMENLEMIIGICKAIVSHVLFVMIHPFGNGNGRTARLIEFKLLLSVGVPFAAAHLLSNHYNKTRTEYYRQLDLISKRNGDLTEFIKYALRGFVDGLVEQLRVIFEDQRYVHWINYVHSQFAEKNRTEDKRRRDLVLELTKINQPIDISQVRTVSGIVASMYGSLTDKTILRDLDILETMELVKKTKKQVVCNFQIINSFISPAIK